jgi:hypothetical protein
MAEDAIYVAVIALDELDDAARRGRQHDGLRLALRRLQSLV